MYIKKLWDDVEKCSAIIPLFWILGHLKIEKWRLFNTSVVEENNFAPSHTETYKLVHRSSTF